MKIHTEVTYPHLLTPKALKIAQGQHVINISEEDWISWNDWMERKEIVDRIVEGVLNWSESLEKQPTPMTPTAAQLIASIATIAIVSFAWGYVKG